MLSLQEIATRLGVIQMTARQAIRTLCNVGVMYSKQGKGTYISAIKHERNFRQLLSFTEETRAGGSAPSSRVLSFRNETGTREARTALEVSPGRKVFRLRRVRYSEGRPMGIECSCLHQHICRNLLKTFDPAASLYRELAERYGIQMEVTDEIAEVGKATAAEAALLKSAPGSPAFLFTRIRYGENGKPLEYVKSVYRGTGTRLCRN